jgi:hypothetical protein
MIPYEELVSALADWRARQGLPPLQVDFLGAPREHAIDTSVALGEDAGMEATSIINLDAAGAQAGLYQSGGAQAPMSWEEEAEDVGTGDFAALEDSGYGADPYQAASYDDQQYGTPEAQQYGAPDDPQDQFAEQAPRADDPYGQPYGDNDQYDYDSGAAQSYDAVQSYDAAPDQGDAQSYDPAQYGGAGEYGDTGGVAEEPTRMTYALTPSSAQHDQSPPGQPYSAPGQAPGVVDERDESTVIGAMLSPVIPAGPAGLAGQASYDSGGGVPDEPVYDSLASAAEYHAEQNYGADQGYVHGDLPTQAYQPVPETDYGSSYDSGGYSADGASENTYLAPDLQGSAPWGGEPPPLAPPPEDDDDFLVDYDAPDEDK